MLRFTTPALAVVSAVTLAWGFWDNLKAYWSGNLHGLIFGMLIAARLGIIYYAISKAIIEHSEERHKYVQSGIWIGAIIGSLWLNYYAIPFLEIIGQKLSLIDKSHNEVKQLLMSQ